jgi:hypothetical protein
MRLSDELTEAGTYYYLRTSQGKTAGGPYRDLSAMGRAILKAEKRGLSRNDLVATKLRDGRFETLSADETEALIASME